MNAKQILDNFIKEMKKREDISVFEKIEKEKYLDKIGYSNFIKLCIEFTQKKILPLTGDEAFYTDLQYAEDFLKGKITLDKLLERQGIAWDSYRNFCKSHNLLLKEKIQRLTVIFLYSNFLYGIEDEKMPDSYEFLFLNLIYKIKEEFCVQFLEFIINKCKLD